MTNDTFMIDDLKRVTSDYILQMVLSEKRIEKLRFEVDELHGELNLRFERLGIHNNEGKVNMYQPFLPINIKPNFVAGDKAMQCKFRKEQEKQ